MLDPHEHVVGIDCERDADVPMASDVLYTLVCAYPGYAWVVMIRGGVLQVKIGDWSQHWGMALHMNDIQHDAGKRKRDVLRAAGEFLERARMIRGQHHGAKPVSIEGVPDKDLARAHV